FVEAPQLLLVGLLRPAVGTAQAQQYGKDEGAHCRHYATHARPSTIELKTVTYLHRSSVSVRRTTLSILPNPFVLQLTRHLSHSRVLFRLRATIALNPCKLVANLKNIGGQISIFMGLTPQMTSI